MKICKKILLVDDDMDIREMVAEILRDEGYTIATAENGQEALDHLISCTPAELPGCIILDLMMPVMTGTQFLERIQKEDLYASISVIVASAKGSLKEELDVLPRHVQKIRKPIDLDELLNTVGRYCGIPAV